MNENPKSTPQFIKNLNRYYIPHPDNKTIITRIKEQQYEILAQIKVEKANQNPNQENLKNHKNKLKEITQQILNLRLKKIEKDSINTQETARKLSEVKQTANYELKPKYLLEDLNWEEFYKLVKNSKDHRFDNSKYNFNIPRENIQGENLMKLIEGCLEKAIFTIKNNAKNKINAVDYDKDIYPISTKLIKSLYRFFGDNNINQSLEGVFYGFYSELENLEIRNIGKITKEYIKNGLEIFFQEIKYVPKIEEVEK